MKTVNTSKTVLSVVAVALILLAALLMIVASNEAVISYEIIAPRPWIIAVYAFAFIAVAVWLFVRAFADSKGLSLAFCIGCALIGVGCEIYGIQNDKISTGTFGIIGALLIITALAFGLISLYRAGNKLICTCIEAVAVIVGLTLTIGAILLLGKEHIVSEAWILLPFPICLWLSGVVLAINRLFGCFNKRALRVCVTVLLAVLILSYSLAYSAALSCTQNYIVAFKLPCALIVSPFTDGDTLVHTDFTGEAAYVSTKEAEHVGKRRDMYFCELYNFSEFPIEKATRG